MDIREPRHALAALETLYRKCNDRPNHYPVTEWTFALRKSRGLGNTSNQTKGQRLELQTLRACRFRVRQLYIWAAPFWRTEGMGMREEIATLPKGWNFALCHARNGTQKAAYQEAWRDLRQDSDAIAEL